MAESLPTRIVALMREYISPAFDVFLLMVLHLYKQILRKQQNRQTDVEFPVKGAAHSLTEDIIEILPKPLGDNFWQTVDVDTRAIALELVTVVEKYTPPMWRIPLLRSYFCSVLGNPSGEQTFGYPRRKKSASRGEKSATVEEKF